MPSRSSYTSESDPFNWEITVYKGNSSKTGKSCPSYKKHETSIRPRLSDISPFCDPKNGNYKQFQRPSAEDLNDPIVPPRTHISHMGTATLIPAESVGSRNGPSRNQRRKSMSKKKKQLAGQSSKPAVSLKPPKTKPGKRKNKKGNHVKQIAPQLQSQAQSIATASSTTNESFSTTRPKGPYKFNVLKRVIWLRPKPDDKFWIRCRIEKCEQSRVDEVKENGKISSTEIIYHVVKCVDDGTLYKVQLQRMEQSENVIWL